MLSFSNFNPRPLTEAVTGFDSLPKDMFITPDEFESMAYPGQELEEAEFPEVLPDDSSEYGATVKSYSDEESQKILGGYLWKRLRKDAIKGTGKDKKDAEKEFKKGILTQTGLIHIDNIGGKKTPSFVVGFDSKGNISDSILNMESPEDLKLETVESFKKAIMERPKQILSENFKMVKSGGEEVQFRNFGIPALIGGIVNEKTGRMVFIKTCPKAGACQLVCYALKGGYAQYPKTTLKLARMLNYLMNDPQGFFEQVRKEISELERKITKKNQKLAIRWHDSGDFFSKQYVDLFINEVVKKFPNITFYAYTKVADVAKSDLPDNFVINFSAGAKPEEEKKVDLKKVKNSTIVTQSVVKWNDIIGRFLAMDGLQVKKVKDKKTGEMKPVTKASYGVLKNDVLEKLKSEEMSVTDVKASDWIVTPDKAKIELKKRLADHYDVPVESVLTYEEFTQTPPSEEKNKYNVIILPGEGDVAASRRDVLSSYLLVH